MVDQTPVDRAEDPFSIFKSLTGKVGGYLKIWRGLFLKVFIENVSLTALKCNLQSRKWFDEKELDIRLVAV